MVWSLSLGLLVAAIMCCGFARCAPMAAPQVVVRHKTPSATATAAAFVYHHHRELSGGDPSSNNHLVDHHNQHQHLHHHHHQPASAEDVSAEAAARSERSANLSHTTGVARKIQFFIKNYHLQILPDGTVNGTLDDSSIYTILQRTAVGIGKLKIQGVGTCQYLCMDTCGLLYGSREFNDECVFNEMIQQHHYNTYSSTKYSNSKRTLYLAFNRRGFPRKVLLHASQPLGRLSSYTRVLTRTVSPKKVEELQHPMRHHAHQCPTVVDHIVVQQANGPLRCRRHKKRKKKKRKCGDSDEDGGDPLCAKRQTQTIGATPKPGHSNISSVNGSVARKCESNAESDECQRVVIVEKKFANKTLKFASEKKPGKKLVKGVKGRLHGGGGGGGPRKKQRTTQVPITTTLLMDYTTDEDYALLESTPAGGDWDDPTMMTPTNAHPD